MIQDFRRLSLNEADIVPSIPGKIRKADGSYTDVLAELGVTKTAVTPPDSANASVVRVDGAEYNVSAVLAHIKSKTDIADALNVMTTRGDIIYQAAAAPARLAKGSAGQVLKMGAEEPAWGEDNNTTYVAASTSAEGLAPQATAPASGLRNIIGIDNGETGYANKALFDATAPSTQALGDAAAVGSAMAAARRDHKHAFPSKTTIMTELQTIDGAASGLDADLLDGNHASVFTIADLEDVTAFNLYYATSQAVIRDLDARLAIAEAELATIP